MTRIVKAFPLGSDAADLERSVTAAHHAGQHAGIIARNCGLCTHEQAVASLRGRLRSAASPVQQAVTQQRVAKRNHAVIAKAIEVEIAKAFDSERSRHGRAALGSGALAGGAVAAGYGATRAARAARPHQVTRTAAARNAAAAHMATSDNFAHIAGDKAVPASMRDFARKAGRTHLRALQHAGVAAEEGRRIARLTRTSRGLAGGAAALTAAAYGVHHHDTRGGGRSYGYR